MTRRLGVLIAAVVCSANFPLQAHHAIGETYDEERTIVVEGEVSSFLFGNPHSMIQLRVPDGQGAAHTWALEWRGAGHLQQLGWTDNALTTGGPAGTRAATPAPPRRRTAPCARRHCVAQPPHPPSVGDLRSPVLDHRTSRRHHHR